MSAPVYSRASAYGRPSSASVRGVSSSARSVSGRSSSYNAYGSFGSDSARTRTASSYRGARYVPTATAEVLPSTPEPRISVVPGQGRHPQGTGLSAGVLTLAKIAAAVAVALALIAVARVTIASAAASCALETREISQSIETARSEGNDLEVAQSVLSNPARIRAQAEAMGMAAPTTEFTDQIILSEDVVATDETGALSLSESTATLAGR